MKVNININSIIDGQNYLQETIGELKITDGGFTLAYRLDGDDCVLKAEGNALTQKRSGAVGIKMKFIQGEYTDCALSEDGCRFPFKLYTHDCSYTLKENCLNVTLCYTSMDAKTNLVLTAQKI